MKIKDFVNGYNSKTNAQKEKYFKDNIKIKTYLPFLEKVELADRLAKVSMLDKDTGNIKIKSDVNYLLFCRCIIENYTNLEIETEGFFEEYDMLNEYGILPIIMSMIPENELKEFKAICDMKRDDMLQNKYETHAFISDQVERFGTLLGITLKPALDKLAVELENMDDKKIDKIVAAIGKGIKRVK